MDNTISKSEILNLGFLEFKNNTVHDSFKIGKSKEAADDCIYWLKNLSFYHRFSSGVLIISKEHYDELINSGDINPNIVHLMCSDRTPRLAFIQILTILAKTPDRTNYAYEHRSSASNVIIMDNVHISKNVNIGEGTIIYPNVVIYEDVTIGKNCIIRENACLGTHGMGFEKDMDGNWVRFPQIGGLIIGDNVEIGSHSDIKRAALDNTIIGDNCKLGSYTNIGHNCEIGKNSIFTSHCVVAGSNIIGENFYCGINASIKNGIKIGDDVMLGANSFLNKNAIGRHTYIGSPATIIEHK